MKVIVNKYFPFHGFIAMAFFNVILWRKEYEYKLHSHYSDIVINHESIHEAQMCDFCKWLPIGGIIFYLLYISEWIFRVLLTKDMFSINAYKNISFEREAKQHENDLDYLNNRKHFIQYKL